MRGCWRLSAIGVMGVWRREQLGGYVYAYAVSQAGHPRYLASLERVLKHRRIHCTQKLTIPFVRRCLEPGEHSVMGQRAGVLQANQR